jgi:hypothetical protein
MWSLAWPSSTGKGDFDDTQWLAVTGSVGAVEMLVGLPDDLKLQVYNLGVDLNLVRHEVPVVAAPSVHVAGAITVDASKTSALVLGDSVFGEGDETLSVTLNLMDADSGNLAMGDVDLSVQSALPLLRAAATNVTQVSSLIVSGVFASGDVIVLTGISEEPLSTPWFKPTCKGRAARA